MLAPDTILQGRYRIIHKLGEGGMGAVYEAIDERLDATVALKETFFTEERLRKQFEREARLMARLHHPALPRVSDHFTESEGQFLVMQFIPGEDLWGMLEKKGGAFSVDEVLTWGDQLLDALDYLHTQEPSIIHRDIKPQNLKLTGRGQIILLDFGLAKGFAGQISRVTTSGSIFGYTPNYAPLEQIQGTGTNERSDLYSLGATLYHLMTGTIPPDALSRATAIMSEQADPLRPANEINNAVPALVADVLHQAMANNPAKRPASAAEMRRLLSDTVQEQAPAKSELRETMLPPTVLSPALQQNVEEHESAPTPPTIAVVAPDQENLTESQKLHLEYWTEFGESLKRRNSFIVQKKPSLLYSINFFPFGRSRIKLSAYAHERDKWIGVGLALYGADAKPRFHLLHQQKEDVEEEIGASLEWKERPNGKESYIILKSNNIDPDNRQDWPHQHEWLGEKLETFYKVFAPRIKILDAGDYSKEEAAPRLPPLATPLPTPPAHDLSPASSLKPSLIKRARKALWIIAVIGLFMAFYTQSIIPLAVMLIVAGLYLLKQYIVQR